MSDSKTCEPEGGGNAGAIDCNGQPGCNDKVGTSSNNPGKPNASTKTNKRPAIVEIHGFILARSQNDRSQFARTLLDFQTTAGKKLKIIKSWGFLPPEVVPGKFCKITNLLCVKPLADCALSPNDLAYVIEDSNQIEIKDNPGIAIPQQCMHNFSGKITAVDKTWEIYEVDGNKMLVLAYVTSFAIRPTLKLGDEVDVSGAHLLSKSGKDYYVVCWRGFVALRAHEERRRAVSPKFCGFAELNSLNINTFLWLKENLPAVKACLCETFLRNLGVPRIELFYGDILLMVLCSNEQIKRKIQKSPISRALYHEFFQEPHSCPFTRSDGLLPSAPRSVGECLHLFDGVEVPPYDSGTSSLWTYLTVEPSDSRPVLAYVDISATSGRLYLTDGTNRRIPLLVVDGQRSNEGCGAILKKIVLIEKAFFVKEEFYENSEIDPGMEDLPTPTHVKCYVEAKFGDIKILGPDSEGFPEWVYKVKNWVEENVASSRTSVPLQDKPKPLESFKSERYIVLDKTPLELSTIGGLSTYIMVKKVPGGTAGTAADSFYRFFKLARPHASYYDLVPSSGEVEIRFTDDQAARIKNVRSTIPYSNGVKSKVKTTNYSCIPPEVEVYVVEPSLNLPNDIHGVAEAVNSAHLGSELFTLSGTIVRRTNQEAKYERERQPPSNNPEFGLPGKSGVIVLCLSDNASANCGMGATLYLSWQNCWRYPLGLLPGASVVVSFVSKVKAEASGTVYFRGTNLTSIEVVKPAEPGRVADKDFVGLPTGPYKDPVKLAVGSAGWCPIGSPMLYKLESEAVCAFCNRSWTGDDCYVCTTFPQTKLKMTARIHVEDDNEPFLMSVGDKNVPVLLGLPDNVLKALRDVVMYSGPLFIGKNKNADVGCANVEALAGVLYYHLSQRIRTLGRNFDTFCRRLKPIPDVNAADLFCVKLLESSLKNEVKIDGMPPSGNISSPRAKRRKLN